MIRMNIRRATKNDIPKINDLLHQVLDIHYIGRPDIFKKDAKKYTDDELLSIIKDDEKPIFVYVENEVVMGYAFCVFQQYVNNNILTDIKTLYIDDLCVDKNARGKHIGAKLYEYVLGFAKENGCYNVTLNVWNLNENAMKFYKKQGLEIQKTYMEKIL